MDRIERLAFASRSLGGLIERDPTAAAILTEPLPEAEEWEGIIRSAAESAGIPGLRTEKRRRLAQIAAHDLSGEIPLTHVGEALAGLADACLQATLEALGAGESLAVVGMGKLGGNELNYVSDIDLLFVGDGNLEAATDMAGSLLRSLGEYSSDGQAYRIDMDLRPEGRSGALVRSLDGYREYYERWADAWEFQALIKARPVAGSPVIGTAFMELITPLIYPREVPSDRITAIRRMKERVEAHAARSTRRGRGSGADDVKLGPGGIRDIEFSAQLLQLVHGGNDESVRERPTMSAIDSLVDGGYLAEDDGAGLGLAYEWLRTVEHRLQLWNERRTHTLPARIEDRSRLARVMGFRDTPAVSAAAQFEERDQSVLADVRSRFEKLFYRPMIESLAEGGGRLSGEALRDRLRVLGFRDVERAARTLSGLVSGTSRRARTFRVLTPALLRWLASSPLPDQGLFSFLRVGEAFGDRIEPLGALRDNPPALALLARVLGSGRILGEVLGHVPEEVAAIAQGPRRTKARTRERLVREATASLEWRPPDERLDGLRRFKRRIFLEIAVDDIGGHADVTEVGSSLSTLADACLQAAVSSQGDVRFAVIGMGKLGGLELNYASDIDIMFVHEGNSLTAERIAENLIAAVGAVTPEGRAFEIDAQIRPEGKSGPLSRSIESFVEYYQRWGRPWEYQALLKARASAGDLSLGADLVASTRGWAWPERLASETLSEIRHLKARMETERIPRGSDPRRNFKLGPGGLSDIEFALQVLQLRHAHDTEGLRVTSTLAAIEGARNAGLIPEGDARMLDSAYRFLCTLRNRLFFIAGRPVDALPPQPERMEALGVALGYEESARQQLEEDYLRITRRCRRVTEPVIYGP